jgi:hypothetical protein
MSADRIQDILGLAKATVQNPKRSLLYGITQADFQAQPEAVTTTYFRDQKWNNVALATPPTHRATMEMAVPIAAHVVVRSTIHAPLAV